MDEVSLFLHRYAFYTWVGLSPHPLMSMYGAGISVRWQMHKGSVPRHPLLPQLLNTPCCWKVPESQHKVDMHMILSLDLRGSFDCPTQSGRQLPSSCSKVLDVENVCR